MCNEAKLTMRTGDVVRAVVRKTAVFGLFCEYGRHEILVLIPEVSWIPSFASCDQVAAVGDELMVAHHDEEWGVPSHDDRHLFELLTLEGAQAGLSWSTILHKREGYRRAFAEFDPEVVARYDARDVERLLESLNRLVDAGHTVLLIEHHMDVIKTADHVIDLGPEGGHAGGEVVVTGTPEEIAACKASHTGRFLKAHLQA